MVYHQKWSRFINKEEEEEEEKTIGEALLSKLLYGQGGTRATKITFQRPSSFQVLEEERLLYNYNIGSCKTAAAAAAGFDLGKEDEEVVEEEMPPLT